MSHPSLAKSVHDSFLNQTRPYLLIVEYDSISPLRSALCLALSKDVHCNNVQVATNVILLPYKHPAFTALTSLSMLPARNMRHSWYRQRRIRRRRTPRHTLSAVNCAENGINIHVPGRAASNAFPMEHTGKQHASNRCPRTGTCHGRCVEQWKPMQHHQARAREARWAD